MTNIHQDIFENIKTILKTHLNENLTEHEDGMYLTIGESGIWVSSNENEFTVGFGFTHCHYNPEYNDINQGIDLLLNLLTKRKRVTNFYKGNSIFKYKTEVELEYGNYEEIGTVMNWLYPFWKPTITKIVFYEKFIDSSELEKEIINLKRK